jgi:predicted HicB family RNase H-like nuclease
MDIQSDDYSGAFYLRCPPSLPAAIRQAARRDMTSASAYVRGAILDRLKRDGHAPKDAA